MVPLSRWGTARATGSSFIELRFSRDSDHEGMEKKKGREHNREPEREVSVTGCRKAEEARKDQQKEKRDCRVGERKSK